MKERLLNVLRRLKLIKAVNLDNNTKVESLNEEVEGLLSQFKTMSEKIDETNEKLVEVLEDEEQKQVAERERLERIRKEVEEKIQESQKLQTKAKANIANNQKVKSKVDEFVI